MQFTEENINEILRLLAGILHTGNIEFVTAGGAQISSKSGRVYPSPPHIFLHMVTMNFGELIMLLQTHKSGTVVNKVVLMIKLNHVWNKELGKKNFLLTNKMFKVFVWED